MNHALPAQPTGSPASPLESLAAARGDQLSGAPAAARTPDAWLFARLVAAREVRDELALLGLSPAQLAALATRHFSATITTGVSHAPAITDPSHAAFVAAMHAFLQSLANPEISPEDVDCLATIIAHACLRPDHLWRDLGLRGREDVSRMLARFFPEVVARNVEGLRWKKLLARELARATHTVPGPAPGCPGCEDFHVCFAAGR